MLSPARNSRQLRPVIGNPDKGSVTVVMSRMNYITEVERLLSNQKHYTTVNKPVYPRAAVSISTTLDKLERTGYISKKEYLEPPNTSRPCILYLLPKIHETKDKWPQSPMPPGRPIISDCNSESYKTQRFWNTTILYSDPTGTYTTFGTAMGKRFAPNYANLFMTE